MSGDDLKMLKVELLPIVSVDQLREAFPANVDYTMNWLFCSTSGVHGSYADLQGYLDTDPNEDPEEDWRLTVLVVLPRRVYVRYGHIPITREDIPWLMSVVEKTIAGVIESQRRNIGRLRDVLTTTAEILNL
jgi:hypothetical protein